MKLDLKNIKPKQKTLGVWAVIAVGLGGVIYTSDDPSAMLTQIIQALMLM